VAWTAAGALDPLIRVVPAIVATTKTPTVSRLSR
jgi:hypothetical protein